MAEFGDPELIAAEFARAHPARRAARRLLAIGPVTGLCWAVALVTGRAWTWPVPMAAKIVPGVALVAVVALLAVAARGARYRPVGRAGTAGCAGTAALDAFMIIGVLGAEPAARWAVAVAVTASAARLALTMHLARRVLAGIRLDGRAAARGCELGGGASAVDRTVRAVVSLLLVAAFLGLSNFAAAVPIVGLLLGHGLASTLGHAAHWIGAGLLIATGLYALAQAIRDQGSHDKDLGHAGLKTGGRRPAGPGRRRHQQQP